MTASVQPGGDQEQLSQRAARQFVTTLYGALRAIRLYPIENATVQKALAELMAASDRVTGLDGSTEINRGGEFLFVNGARLRLGVDNYAALSYLLGQFRAAGIGGFRTNERPEPREWVVLLSALVQPPATRQEEEGWQQFTRLVEQGGVTRIGILQPNDDGAADEEPDLRERARRTYLRSLDVSREMMTTARLGRSPNLKRVKRAVQGIVDQLLTDEQSMIGLTTLRDFDEYTFVHSVNVCIFSVALGRRLGCGKTQLFDLGMAALLHDIGKSRVPAEVLNKAGGLTDEEREIVGGHTWQGVLVLFGIPVVSERPYRGMVTCFEHHLKIDSSGYPRVVRERRMTLFSRIVAVADGYDAATSARVYQERPWSPADVLRGMRENPRLGFDPLVVKAFIALTGVFPVGTLVTLDTLELALVYSAHPDPAHLARPIVRVLTDGQGNFLADAPVVDLSTTDATGAYLRTIIRTEDPDRYGIRIGDYFV
ncbi:MAG: HD-GYP domain-containing protein [Gemmatimonadaceae bacterium]|nr:HD-GYP domain-containing protein [Gemmatimonadaceae bacterium]